MMPLGLGREYSTRFRLLHDAARRGEEHITALDELSYG